MRNRITLFAAALTLATAVASPMQPAQAAARKLSCTISPALTSGFKLSQAQYQSILNAEPGTTMTINGATVVKTSPAGVTPITGTVDGVPVTLSCS